MKLKDVLSQLEETEKTASSESQVGGDELRKEAAEYDAIGRIMAQSFSDELQKIAVGLTGVTPNTAQEGGNPAVQVSNGEVAEENVSKAVSIIKKLTAGAEAAGPSGLISEQSVPVSGAQPTVVANEKPVAADVNKTAAAAILGELYNRVFGE